MKKALCIMLAFLSVSALCIAEEGMWLLNQMKEMDLKAMGLHLTAEQIYHPQKPSITDAVIQLGGGTASFVSSNGLVLTNHHVAFEAVQRASTQGTDYLTNGFLAKSWEEEIQGPGLSAVLITEMKDVSKEVLAAAEGITDALQKDRAIRAKMQEITDKIEKNKKDITATVAEMYNGKQYILYIYKRFDDIRVVCMPPMNIGNYGGEIDNWMWPRHTADFALVRVYVSPKGEGRDFDAANVPYKPKYWLKPSNRGLNPGDMTFALGYPGFTTRYRTSNSVAWNLHHNYPNSIKTFEEIINLLNEIGKTSPEAEIKVADLSKGLSNVMKNFQGKVEGMTKTRFVEKKKAFEEELMQFIKRDPELQKTYGHVLDDIRQEYKGLETLELHDNALQNLLGLSGTLFSVAWQFYNLSKEREKPDTERDPNFSERDVKRTVERLPYQYYSYLEAADKALLRRTLHEAAALPENNRIAGLNYIQNNYQSMDDFIDKAYQTTRLADVAYAQALSEKSSAEMEKLNDPFINLAAALYVEIEDLQKRNEKFAARITELRKEYINALYAWKGSKLYPDANGTIRFTWGKIAGYSPRDAVQYAPFTTLTGVIEKDNGKEPFNMPDKLRVIHQNKNYGPYLDNNLQDVPVDFTHKVDTTGGNSGSPVLNAYGELIGILFDGNYEAMNSDWQYDDKIQRSISVDIRYVQFIMDKFMDAGFLLQEMGS